VAAQHYYEEGMALGPTRPQTLYGLFDVYRFEGNVASTTAIAEKIESQWPSDQGIRQGLAAFLAQAAQVQKAGPVKKK
jgi:hypothetical protein